MSYYILTASTALSGVICQMQGDISALLKKRILAVIWMGIVLLVGLQGLDANADSLAFHYTYAIEPLSYSLLEYFIKQKHEFVFYLSSYILSKIGIPWQIYLMIYAAFVFGVMLYWIFLYSEDVFLSALIFETTFFAAWVIAMRSGLALAFMILAYISIRNGKKKRGVLFILLAVFSHNSIMLLLPFFVLRNIRFSNAMLSLYVMLTVTTLLFRSQLLDFINLVAKALGRNTYGLIETETTYTFTTLLLMVIILGLWFRKNLANKNNIIYSDGMHALLCAFLFLNIVGGGVKLRIVYYYAIFMCLLIPMILRSIRPRPLSRFLVILLLVVLYVRGANFSRYYFFWQESMSF